MSSTQIVRGCFECGSYSGHHTECSELPLYMERMSVGMSPRQQRMAATLEPDFNSWWDRYAPATPEGTTP